MKISLLSNPVIAHRGAWKQSGHPENSIEALKAAQDLGCGAVELDVWLSADDQLIVHHDPDFNELVIEACLAEDLALPSLEDFLHATELPLVIEIKPPRRRERIVQRVLESVGDRPVIYISFDLDVLREIRRLDKAVNLQYLLGDRSPAELYAEDIRGLDYHYRIYQQNPQWIGDAQALGMSLNTWTVNDALTMQAFLKAGFDMITTDEPELCLSLLKK